MPAQAFFPINSVTHSLIPSFATSSNSSNNFTPTSGQLSSLNRHHLLLPSDRTTRASHSSDLIAAETGNTDVVLAFEDELDIADLEGGGAAELGDFAGGGNDVIDEFVCYVEEDLESGVVS